MRRVFSSALFCLVVVLAAARADSPRCIVCQSLVSGQFYWWQSPMYPAKQPICEACSKLETLCAVCKVPIRYHGRQLEDGRWLCDRDLAAGIFNQAETQRVYEEVWRDLQRMLAGTGTLPRQNITVSLVDSRELKRQNDSMPSDHEGGSLQGLTRTRSLANREFQHRIFLISGLGRARLAAVCAHEYTHTWLHENIPANRALSRDAVEGFCELVAYKLMAQRHEELEKSVILANAYTRGQVNAFVQAEAEQQFHRVIQWIKTGVQDAMAVSNAAHLADVRREEPEIPVWPPPPPTPTSVPDTLMLRGIAGDRSHHFVLINDCTLTTNEEGRVRVGTSNVVIRCVAIRERSAVIRVQGCAEPRELFLGAN